MPTDRRSRPITLFRVAFILGVLALSPVAISGEFTDDLSGCLVSSTTEGDKLSLVKWMFAAMALHPAVTEMADVSLSAREQSNREMAELLVELLRNRCYSETQLALQNEGALALQTSFSILGQVAATSLFADPKVSAGLASIETYINAEDLVRQLEIGQ